MPGKNKDKMLRAKSFGLVFVALAMISGCSEAPIHPTPPPPDAGSSSGGEGGEGGSGGAGGQGGEGGSSSGQGGGGLLLDCVRPEGVKISATPLPTTFFHAGDKNVRCLDIRIENKTGFTFEFCDTPITVTAANNGTLFTAMGANYTALRLIKRSNDGSFIKGLVGPGEIDLNGSNTEQKILLKGQDLIQAGETVDASFVFHTSGNLPTDSTVSCRTDIGSPLFGPTLSVVP